MKFIKKLKIAIVLGMLTFFLVVIAGFFSGSKSSMDEYVGFFIFCIIMWLMLLSPKGCLTFLSQLFASPQRQMSEIERIAYERRSGELMAEKDAGYSRGYNNGYERRQYTREPNMTTREPKFKDPFEK